MTLCIAILLDANVAEGSGGREYGGGGGERGHEKQVTVDNTMFLYRTNNRRTRSMYVLSFWDVIKINMDVVKPTAFGSKQPTMA